MENLFSDFIKTVSDNDRGFITDINQYLLENGCECKIELAKSGYVVSYIFKSNKATLANFVTRKIGIKIRIYADNISKYSDFLDTLPEKMKQEFIKASDCKRLINPAACNQRCKKGFEFMLNSERYQKCRFMAFMPTVNEYSYKHILAFLEHEVNCR